MRSVLTARQIQQYDRRAIDELGIPGVVLMENAGIKIVEFMRAQFQEHCPVYIFCGKGNNGGDGFVVARHLINHNYPVEIFLTCDPAELKGDALINAKILQKMKISITTVRSSKKLPAELQDGIILDGLLGTGISGDVRGVCKEIIEWLNLQNLPIISIDLPSGMNADNGSVGNCCIQADYTITMGEFKRGLLIPPGNIHAGDVFVADIGFPQIIKDNEDPKTYVLQKQDILCLLPERPVNAHKGSFGKVAVLAGSRGMTGAAILSSTAALRAGAGLVKLGIPESLNAIIESQSIEVMTAPLPETEAGSIASLNSHEIDSLVKWADVLAIGPGLSVHPETRETVQFLIQKSGLPMVLDADGINLFEGDQTFIRDHFQGILTPHPGELARLIQLPIREIEADPIEISRQYAEKLNCILVLKGAPAIIASPDGRVFINSTGNSGLATGGSGDVLTGIISGLMAQKMNGLDAALCSVYLHGLAGDLIAAQKNERSLIAGDLLNFISEAFNAIEEVA